jgi:hypothetical protein
VSFQTKLVDKGLKMEFGIIMLIIGIAIVFEKNYPYFAHIRDRNKKLRVGQIWTIGKWSYLKIKAISENQVFFTHYHESIGNLSPLVKDEEASLEEFREIIKKSKRFLTTDLPYIFQ